VVCRSLHGRTKPSVNTEQPLPSLAFHFYKMQFSFHIIRSQIIASVSTVRLIHHTLPWHSGSPTFIWCSTLFREFLWPNVVTKVPNMSQTFLFFFYVLLTVHLNIFILVINTRGCIIQFWPSDDEHMVLETCRGMKYTYCKTKILCIKLVNH